MYAASPRPLEKFQARFDHFQELKLCFPFLVNPFNINVSVMAVQMVNRLPTGWLTVCYKLVCCRNKTDRNARKSRSKITLANATLHLILVNRFQKANIQNLKYQCITHFCVKHSMVLWFFCLCHEVRKIKPSCNPEKWTFGRINSHSFGNILSRFSGTRKSNKNLILTITVHHLM